MNMADYRYMRGGNNVYENDGDWTKAELEAMLERAENDIDYYDKAISEMENGLYNAESTHDKALYLLDNELCYVEEDMNVLQQTKEGSNG